MKALPVNLLSSSGSSNAVFFVLLALGAVAILATKKPAEQPKK